jgi:hypothetical protein
MEKQITAQMNKWWLLWLAVLPLAAWPQTDDLTYKGVPLGASMSEYKAKLPDQKCDDKFGSCRHDKNDCISSQKSAEEMVACFGRNSFGGVTMNSTHAQFREGKLVEVYFTFGDVAFDQLTGAARERLGKPTKVVDSAIQTRGGATLQNREMIWERRSMVLTVKRYGSTIDKGSAVLTTPQERDRKIAEYEAAKKKGAKDF